MLVLSHVYAASPNASCQTKNSILKPRSYAAWRNGARKVWRAGCVKMSVIVLSGNAHAHGARRHTRRRRVNAAR